MSAAPRKALIILPPSNDPEDQLKHGLAKLFPNLIVNRVASHADAGPYISEADILLSFGILLSDETLRAASHLKWLHVLGSGTDGVFRPTLKPDVIVTNSRGLQGDAVSETALALMFALARQIPALVRQQDKAQWQRKTPMLLRGKNAVIVGVGAIAEVLAAKCNALGLKVVGVSDGRVAAPGFTHIYKRAQLAEAAAQADFLVILAPGSAATAGMINAQVISAMKPSAVLINVGRGSVVDEAALIAALKDNKIAGGGLDVFATEPLPVDHAFWSMPNVLISPHVGGLHAGFIDDLLPLLDHNIHAFLANDPARMKNIVARNT